MTDTPSTLQAQMQSAGNSARARALAHERAARTAAIAAMARRLRAAAPLIIDANESDIAQAREGGRDSAFIDRLMLNPARMEAIAASLEQIAAQPDPLGAIMADGRARTGL